MDTNTVVVASVYVCETKNVDLQISEFADMLDVPDLWSFIDAGPKGPSPVNGDTSDPPIPVSVVNSGPGPPEPELGDKLRLQNFSSDIDRTRGNVPTRGPGVLFNVLA